VTVCVCECGEWFVCLFVVRVLVCAVDIVLLGVEKQGGIKIKGTVLTYSYNFCLRELAEDRVWSLLVVGLCIQVW
jgi:hypothetical protein